MTALAARPRRSGRLRRGDRLALGGGGERVAVAVIALAWLLILVPALRSALGATPGSGAHAMAGMQAGPPGSAVSARSVAGMVVVGFAPWMLMTVAMMGPAAFPGLRHTRLNSLRWRRGRAMAEFCLGYLAVWALAGTVLLALVALIPAGTRVWWLTASLVGAAAWQLSTVKAMRLRDCHRSWPLPPTGARADRGALRFGWRNGGACLGSCWCLMAVMALASVGAVLWMAGLSAIVTAERFLQRPRRVTRAAAAALGALAVATALI